MKNLKLIYFSAIVIGLAGCTKEAVILPFNSTYQNQQTIPVPNGSFENWNMFLPENWTTNSCPACAAPFMTDIVQADSDVCDGNLAAKFYFVVYPAWAENRFPVAVHPVNLTACVKCNLYGVDTVLVKVSLLFNSLVVDSGKWIGTSTISNYTTITVPVTQNSASVDSAVIYIEGPHGPGFPMLWVDHVGLN
jgi:hypothetical protein